MSYAKSLLACTVSQLILIAAASAQSTGSYNNISVVGDGVTPTSSQLFTAQRQQLQVATGAATVGDSGQVSYTLPVELPPALHMPEFSVGYSGGGSLASLVAPGWSINGGMSIQRMTGRELTSWPEAIPGPGGSTPVLTEMYRVTGGGLNGIFARRNGVKEYIAGDDKTPEYTHHSDDSWSVIIDGVETLLQPHRSDVVGASAADAWHTVRSMDASGNTVDYAWQGIALQRVEYGGTAIDLKNGTVEPHIVGVWLDYDFIDPNLPVPRRLHNGNVDEFDRILTGVRVRSRYAGHQQVGSWTTERETVLEQDTIDGVARVTGIRAIAGQQQDIARLDYADLPDADGYTEPNVLYLPDSSSAVFAPIPLTTFTNTRHWPARALTDAEAEHIFTSYSEDQTTFGDATGDGLPDQWSTEASIHGPLFRPFLWSMHPVNWTDPDDLGGLWAPDTAGLLGIPREPFASDPERWNDTSQSPNDGGAPSAHGATRTYSVRCTQDDVYSLGARVSIDIDGDGLVDSVESLSAIPEQWDGVYNTNTCEPLVGLISATTADWEIRYGTRSGFSTPEIISAPVAFPQIGIGKVTSTVTPPISTHMPEARWRSGQRVQMMDIDGDGWKDIVEFSDDIHLERRWLELPTPGGSESTTVRYHSGKREGGWGSAQQLMTNVGSSGLPALQNRLIGPILTLEELNHAELDDDGVDLTRAVAQPVSSTIVRQFIDLNGDGLLDYVDASESAVPGESQNDWLVWFGTGARDTFGGSTNDVAFLPAVHWRIPTTVYDGQAELAIIEPSIYQGRASYQTLSAPGAGIARTDEGRPGITSLAVGASADSIVFDPPAVEGWMNGEPLSPEGLWDTGSPSGSIGGGSALPTSMDDEEDEHGYATGNCFGYDIDTFPMAPVNAAGMIGATGFVNHFDGIRSATPQNVDINSLGIGGRIRGGGPGVPAIQLSGLIDVNGDGLPDLVDAARGRWWRNNGAGFENDPTTQDGFLTPEVLDEGLNQAYTDTVSGAYVERLGSVEDDQFTVTPTNSTSKRYTTVMVLDLDQDGSLDRIELPHGGYLTSSGILYGPAAQSAEGERARPGALVSVVTAPGMQQDFAYTPSTRLHPSGFDESGSGWSEHTQSQHRMVVDAVEITDLTTDMAARTTYEWSEGYCVPGDCRGFARVTTMHAEHDADLHGAGLFQDMSKSKVTRALTRYGNYTLTEELFTSRDEPTVAPGAPASQLESEALYTTSYLPTLSPGAELYPVVQTIAATGQNGVDVPRVHLTTGTEGNDQFEQYTRTTGTSYEYDEGRLVQATHRALSAANGQTQVPSDFIAGCQGGQASGCSKHTDDVRTEVEWTSDNETIWRPCRVTTSHRDPLTWEWIRSELAEYAYDDGLVCDPLTQGLMTQSVVRVKEGSSGHDLVWRFKRNNRGAITQLTGPPDDTRQYDFTLTFGDALRLSVQDPIALPGSSLPRGETFTTYDAMGRAVQTVDPNGVIERSELDGFGRVVSTFLTPAGGNEHHISFTHYDDALFGDAWSSTATFEYSAPGVYAGVHGTRTLYSGGGEAIQQWSPSPFTAITDPSAPDFQGGYYVTDTVRNVAGTVVRTSRPKRHGELSFDAFRDLRQHTSYASCGATDAFGRTRQAFTECTATESELKGEESVTTTLLGPGLASILDGSGIDYVKQTYSDTRGRLVSVFEGEKGSLLRTGTYGYDGNGRILSFLDGEDNRYGYVLDGAGRPNEVYRTPNGGSEQLWYSFAWYGPEPEAMWEGAAEGQPSSQWWYDGLGRTVAKRITGPNGSPDQMYEWNWDEEWYGARSSTQDPWGTTYYEYSPGAYGTIGQPTRTERVWADQFGALKHSATYDLMGRTVSEEHPDGSTVQTTIDSQTGLPERQRVDWGEGVEYVFPEYEAQWGQPAGWSSGSDAAMHLLYDRPGRIRGYSMDLNYTGGTADYTYRADGLLKEKVFGWAGDERYSQAYDYDFLKRVSSTYLREKGNSSVSRQEHFSYDLLGNFTETNVDGTIITWDSDAPFSQPEYTLGHGDVIDSIMTWDTQGRLASRSHGKSASKYYYDGAGRLQSIEGDVGETIYGYDVDDNLIYEERKNGRIWRFGTYRYEESEKMIIVKPVPQIAIERQGGATQERWVFLEPDGHALQTVAGVGQQPGQELSYQILGAYGRTLAQEGKPMPIDGFHGADADTSNGVVPFGVRHTLKDVGVWLQPEPLLYLGISNTDTWIPRSSTGVYARGNPVSSSDTSGFTPIITMPWVSPETVGIQAGFLSNGSIEILEAPIGLVNAAAHPVQTFTRFDHSEIDPIASSVMEGVRLVDDIHSSQQQHGSQSLQGRFMTGWHVGRAVNHVFVRAAQYGTGVMGAVGKFAGSCFVEETQVPTPRDSVPIASLRVADLVIAAASTDVGEQPWVEVEDAQVERQAAWAPRGVFERVTRWARAAAIPIAVMSTREAPAAIAPDAVVEVYDARTGAWSEGVGGSVEAGATGMDEGRVLRVTSEGVHIRGAATSGELAEADATWVAEAAHGVPAADDWVLVLGDAGDAGHWRLSEVDVGYRFAFQGRVFDTADADGDGRLEVRWSGDVLGKVVNTFVRMAPEVIDAEIAYADGETDTLTGTPNHPFWVPAVRDYVPLGELEVGTVLHVQGGGEAILVSKTWRQGEFEVFDFEVEGLHNFYVRGSGSDAAGVLVHNSTGRVNLASPSRTRHILDGDATGGGHGPGRGISDKSEFPSRWSDADVMEHISDVVTDPAARHTQLTGRPGATTTRAGDPVRYATEGTRDGVDIRVISDSTGEIITGYPTNVPRNP